MSKVIEKAGKTGVWQEYRREPDVSTLLYDFDIDSARLKMHHRLYIEKILAPLIMGRSFLVPWTIKIIGHTSASGSDGHNKELSLRRARAVANHLRMHTPLRTLHIDVEGAGEEYAKAWEGQLDRAVHIKAVPGAGREVDSEPPPIKDEPLPPRVGGAQKFHLRFLKISKVGFKWASKTNIEIEITDEFRRHFRYYKFEATEISAGIGFPVQIGVGTKASKYHAFWTRPGSVKLMRTSDFAGDAVLIKKGVGSSEFKFGGLVPGSWSEWNHTISPIEWDEPSFLNWDALGIMDGPMRRTGLDL